MTPIINKLIDGNFNIYSKDMIRLKETHNDTELIFKNLFESFELEDYTIAEEIIKMKLTSVKKEFEFKKQHYSFICANEKDAVLSTSVFLDLLNCYRAINSNLASIAYILKGEMFIMKKLPNWKCRF